MGQRVHIEVLAGPNVGEAYDFDEDQILVGRGSNCGLQLASPHVSRQQCELSRQGDQLILENLGSVNGTYLNDRPIDRVYVQDGDLITFCDVALRVRLPRAGVVEQDPDRTVAYATGQSPPGGGVPQPQAPPPPPPPSDATHVQQGPAGMSAPTPMPGPLPGGPPGGLPGGLPPAPPLGFPAGAPVYGGPGGFGTGQFQPYPPPPPGQNPYGQPPGPPQGPPGMPLPPGMPQPPAPGTMPYPHQAIPGPQNMAPGAGQTHPDGPPGQNAGVLSATRRRKKPRGGKAPPNIQLIRNVVVALAAVMILLSVISVVLKKTESAKKVVATPTPVTEPDPFEGLPKVDRGDRLDSEILASAEKAWGTGRTYLREYQIADENLWMSITFFKRCKAELLLLDASLWPSWTSELDARIGEAEGNLDQEYRHVKLNFVKFYQSGDYEQADRAIDRALRMIPDREDERHQYMRNQQKRIRNLKSGGKSPGRWGG
jgi:hypothetical protein